MSEENNRVEAAFGEPVFKQAALEAASQNVGKAAKEVGQRVKKLFEKVMDVQQLSLLDEPEFEQAVLEDGEKLRKRYTGEQAEKIEWRRDACLYMLGRECPVEEIASVLRMNLRTISALAAQNGRKLGGFSDHFARELMASAASDIALAHTKRDDASYKDLHIGAGIKMQHAMGVKLVAEGSEKPAVDVEAVSEKRAAFLAKLKALKPAVAEEAKI